ncbi:outer membrane beta-barrel protein [Flavobacterium weaverense]|uniref:Outer membrane protein with beta-barrel domain n=1 Tax=Flavobacterium weaverense TaxID=271156 RepID=A0A3L9ZWK5_9FLAO|nr:outer membrane beta-barrel protein [Flavobacterium weaverense]RMA76800.1 outer membrane protein with beta-barrel domain [Flavobacterium weaverense]
MKKNLFLLGFMACSMTMMGQTDQNESWYFKLGGSFFTQTAATEFPTVGGNAALSKVYVGGKLISEESVTGSFGEGFRTGFTAGYRFNQRLGVEMGVNYYNSTDKTMAQTMTDNIFISGGKPVFNFKSVGQITAFDLAPALVLFLGEHKGFEPYTKVGVLVPIHGDLVITTDAIAPTGVPNPATVAVRSVDKVKPNPTLGFMSALGTSYKLGKNISAFAELEYRNFTVHGKTKETTEYTVNGNDALATRTQAQIHTNYQDKINVNSNNASTNASFDSTKPMDELSSYVGISGLGLTLGLKYSL